MVMILAILVMGTVAAAAPVAFLFWWVVREEAVEDTSRPAARLGQRHQLPIWPALVTWLSRKPRRLTDQRKDEE